MVLALALIGHLELQLRPVLEAMAVAKVKNVVAQTLDAAVAAEISARGVTYGDLITIERDGSGSITALTSDMTVALVIDADGFVKTAGRRFLEIPQLYEDFTLLWRDLENSEKFGYPVDLSAAVAAAQAIARREDGLIFFGNDALGYEGLFNVAGRQTLPMN